MSGYYINIHVKANDSASAHLALTELFAEHGFALASNEAAEAAIETDLQLHEESGWYGAIVSPATADSWVSIYVDDWQDSGVLAIGLSRILKTSVLEVWVAHDVHWGYAYFESGEVRDRFADDPSNISDQASEISALAGKPEALAAILHVPVVDFEQSLTNARANSGQFVGPAIDAIEKAVGVPFDHILIGYESFFEDDPEDYIPGLSDWPNWRHFAFKHPAGRDRLAD